MKRKEFLLPTLRSVVNQTIYSQIKLFVVDDGSSDETVSYVKEIQRQINFDFIPLSENLGKHHLLNEVVQKNVQSPYLMILDSDDLLMPAAAEKLLAMFKENSELNCVKSSQAILSDQKIKHRSIVPLNPSFYQYYMHHFGAMMGNTGALWKTSAFKKTIKVWTKSDPLYPLSRMACEDSLRLYLLPESDRIFNAIDQALMIYRMHANQWTASKENLSKCDIEVYDKFRKNLNDDDLLIPLDVLKRNRKDINIHTYIHLLISMLYLKSQKKWKLVFKEIFKVFLIGRLISPCFLILIPHLFLVSVNLNSKVEIDNSYSKLKWWWPKTLSTDKKLSSKEQQDLEAYLMTLEYAK